MHINDDARHTKRS